MALDLDAQLLAIPAYASFFCEEDIAALGMPIAALARDAGEHVDRGDLVTDTLAAKEEVMLGLEHDGPRAVECYWPKTATAKTFPPARLKSHRTFVKNLERNPGDHPRSVDRDGRLGELEARIAQAETEGEQRSRTGGVEVADML